MTEEEQGGTALEPEAIASAADPAPEAAVATQVADEPATVQDAAEAPADPEPTVAEHG